MTESFKRRSVKLLSAVSIAAASVVTLASSTDAHAQAATENPVTGTGKGIAGGALLGAEVGFISLSAAGAHQSWLYYTVPTALAIGGGIGGYYIENGKTGTDAAVPMFMLAGGMALIIPTVVITLTANPTYVPTSEDSTPSDAMPADAGNGLGVKVNAGATSTTTGSPSVPTPGSTGTGSGTTTTTPPAGGPPKHKPDNSSMRTPTTRAVPALFSLDMLATSTSLRLGVPAVSFRPMYTRTEVAAFSQTQKYEVNAPLFAMAF